MSGMDGVTGLEARNDEKLFITCIHIKSRWRTLRRHTATHEINILALMQISLSDRLMCLHICSEFLQLDCKIFTL